MAKEYRKDSNSASPEFQNLKNAVKNNCIGKLYVFYGEETYLKRYYLDLLFKKLVEGPAEEFNYHKYRKEAFQAGEFAEAVSAYPVFADKSLIVVEDVDPFKLSEKDRTILTDALNDIPEYCSIVFYFDTVAYKPDKRMKRPWEAFENHCEQVEFKKQSESDLMSWAQRHFKAYGKTIENKLCRELLHAAGYSMTVLSQEISKLSAYAEGPQITPDDVKAVVEPVLDAVVFDITDAIASGNFGEAMTLLQSLLARQEEPLNILGAIGAHFRRTYAAKILISKGESINQICTLTGVKPFAAQKLVYTAGRMSEALCRNAVLLCEETDYRIKSSFDDPRAMLELLMIKLAEAYKNA